jgi:hypothetical protein
MFVNVNSALMCLHHVNTYSAADASEVVKTVLSKTLSTPSQCKHLSFGVTDS